MKLAFLLSSAALLICAVATDGVGNSATSTVAGRVVDNTPRTITLADPGSLLSGTVTLEATASAPGGATSVAIQRSPAGANQWTTICTDSSAPYTCSWNTQQAGDGLYDLRAVMTDGQGTLPSATIASRRVANVQLAAADVQAFNRGGQVGRPDAGDQVVYTFNREVDLTSIIAGWDGSDATVVASMRAPFLAGDSILTIDQAPALGSVDLGARYNRTISLFNRDISYAGSTLAAPVETGAGGVRYTVVTLTLGGHSSAALQLSTAATMTWSPTSSLRDPSGRAASTADAMESGARDVDF